MTYKHNGLLYTSNAELQCVYKTAANIGATKHQGWARDALGRAFITFADTGNGDYFHNGARYSPEGALYVEADGNSSSDSFSGGLRFTGDRKTYVTAGAFAPGDTINEGLRRNANGAMYIAGTALADYVATLSPAAWSRYGVGITVTGSGVSNWADQSVNGRDLKQGTDSARPALQADGSILLDGVSQFLKCDAFTLNQPETVYLLGKQVTWTSTDRIFDGDSLNSGALAQSTTTPRLDISAGSGAAPNTNLAVDTYAVVAVVFNGASSLSQINMTAPATGNAGAGNMGGFTLGASGSNSLFGNIQVKEAIIFPAAHDAATRSRVIRYLSSVGLLSI